MSSPLPPPQVLVLGSGLCCPPLVDYLSSHRIPLVLASRTQSKAEALVAALPDPEQQRYVAIVAYDIENKEEQSQGYPRLRELMSAPSIQISVSMLPYIHHVAVAQMAITLKKHCFTTSYVSPAMAELDTAAKEAGVLLLNECGLDPGLDHMSAKKFIDRMQAQGGKVVSFRSLCGGLPSLSAKPNPLGYKLSWSPRGVLLAARNTASYLDRAVRKTVSGATLYEAGVGYNLEDWEGEYGLDGLEYYPNRDSVPYRAIFNMPECHTLLRGTYRMKGWSHFMQKVSIIGYVTMDEVEFEEWRAKSGEEFNMAQLTYLLAKKKQAGEGAAASFPGLLSQSNINLRTFVAEVLSLPLNDAALDKLEWLGCFDPSCPVPLTAHCALDAMSARFDALLQYEKGEKDLIVMRHTFEVEFPEEAAKEVKLADGQVTYLPASTRREQWTSTLVSEGRQHPDTGVGYSAMSLTVAYPVGVAIRAMLEGRLPTTMRGVVRPIEPELYNLILDEMEEKFDVKFTETKVESTEVWMRAEVKKGERRAALHPDDVRSLIQSGGIRVRVERSDQRAIPDSAYEAAGATLVHTGSWVKDASTTAIVLGLKELPEDEPDVLFQKHIFFAHAFKHQAGWEQVLKRFTQILPADESPLAGQVDANTKVTLGRGLLYDLEFLTDDRGVRVCAFGRQAGLVGMGLGLLQYAARVSGTTLQAPLQHWNSLQAMIDDCKAALSKLPEEKRTPKILVLGAKGRCGQGAVHVCTEVGGLQLTQWDIEETRVGGPFPQLAEQDVLVNCIYLPAGVKIPPFLTLDLVASAGEQRALSVVVDVSCDSTNPLNPLPLYQGGTTLFDPVQKVQVGEGAHLDVIAIDHLPALLPVESTHSFSEALLPHLQALKEGGDKHASAPIWKRAEDLFRAKLDEALKQ